MTCSFKICTYMRALDWSHRLEHSTLFIFPSPWTAHWQMMTLWCGSALGFFPLGCFCWPLLQLAALGSHLVFPLFARSTLKWLWMWFGAVMKDDWLMEFFHIMCLIYTNSTALHMLYVYFCVFHQPFTVLNRFTNKRWIGFEMILTLLCFWCNHWSNVVSCSASIFPRL